MTSRNRFTLLAATLWWLLMVAAFFVWVRFGPGLLPAGIAFLSTMCPIAALIHRRRTRCR